MHYFKLILLAGLFLMGLTLVFSFGMNLYSAFNAPFRWKAEGTVIALIPAVEEGQAPVSSNLGQVVVEYRDPHGELQKGTYGRANSGGPTEFFDKKVGDRFSYELQFPDYVPGGYRYYRWNDLAWVLTIFGAVFVLAGAFFKFV